MGNACGCPSVHDYEPIESDAPLPRRFEPSALDVSALNGLLKQVSGRVTAYQVLDAPLKSASGVTQAGQVVLAWAGETHPPKAIFEAYAKDARTVPAAPAGCPRTMYFKYSSIKDSYVMPMIPDRLVVCLGNMSHEAMAFGEHQFYTQFQARTDAVGIRTPRCFACSTDGWMPPSGCLYRSGFFLCGMKRDIRQLLLMEDLTGAESLWGPWTCPQPEEEAPPAVARAMLQQAAQLHAAFWDDRVALASLGTAGIYNFGHGSVFKAGITRLSRASVDKAIPLMQRMAEASPMAPKLGVVRDARFPRVMREMQSRAPDIMPMMTRIKSEDNLRTVLHGDLHGANAICRYKQGVAPTDPNAACDIKVIDWQWMRKGTPGMEVSFFLNMSVMPSEEGDRSLIETYYQELLRAARSEDPQTVLPAQYKLETLLHEINVCTLMLQLNLMFILTLGDVEKQYHEALEKGGQTKILYEMLLQQFVKATERVYFMQAHAPLRKRYFGEACSAGAEDKEWKYRT